MHFTRKINRTSTSLLCKGIEPKLWKWGEVLLAQTAFELVHKKHLFLLGILETI